MLTHYLNIVIPWNPIVNIENTQQKNAIISYVFTYSST